MKQCPNCGANAQDGWIICPSCGINIQKASDILGRDYYIPPESEPFFTKLANPPGEDTGTQTQSIEGSLPLILMGAPNSKAISILYREKSTNSDDAMLCLDNKSKEKAYCDGDCEPDEIFGKNGSVFLSYELFETEIHTIKEKCYGINEYYLVFRKYIEKIKDPIPGSLKRNLLIDMQTFLSRHGYDVSLEDIDYGTFGVYTREFYRRQAEINEEKKKIKTETQLIELKKRLDFVDSDSILDYYIGFYHQYPEDRWRYNDAFKRYILEEIFPFDPNSLQKQIDDFEWIVHLIESEHFSLLSNFADKWDQNNHESLQKLSRLLEIKGVSVNYISSLETLLHLIQCNNSIIHYFGFLREIVNNDHPTTVYENIVSFNQRIPEIEAEYNVTLIHKFLLKNGFEVSKKEILESIERVKLLEFENEVLNNYVNREQIELDSIDGYEFEDLLVQIFERAGYNVTHTPYSNDMGADLVIQDGNDMIAIQAKHMPKVGPSAIQEVVGSMRYYGASNGMVITTGVFTRAARDLADVNRVILWGRDELLKFVEKNS